MKLCQSCSKRFSLSEWKCPSCGFTPQFIEGYPIFSSELLNKENGFKVCHFQKLFDVEASNFWFRSRNQLINWALKKYFSKTGKLLEIGCGTGFVLSNIQTVFPNLILSGSDVYIEALKCSSRRLPKVDLIQMDARNMPFEGEFDIIGAFDVLEHIEEDEIVLAQAYKSLCKEGGIILTVPQHIFLWSKFDEFACHVRRYDLTDLSSKIKKAGFEIVKATSFVTLLMPLMLISRILKKHFIAKEDAGSELISSGFMNKMFEMVMFWEQVFIKKGLSFPFGGSLLIVARKTKRI